MIKQQTPHDDISCYKKNKIHNEHCIFHTIKSAQIASRLHKMMVCTTVYNINNEVLHNAAFLTLTFMSTTVGGPICTCCPNDIYDIFLLSLVFVFFRERARKTTIYRITVAYNLCDILRSGWSDYKPSGAEIRLLSSTNRRQNRLKIVSSYATY